MPRSPAPSPTPDTASQTGTPPQGSAGQATPLSSGQGQTQPSAAAQASSAPPGGPVGKGDYEVQTGDCIESIAFNRGFFWETIWNHANNQQLKAERKDANVLLAGDIVFIPDLRPKQEIGPTEHRHRFKRRGVPSMLRIVLKYQDQPRANQHYLLSVDGQLFEGNTDGDGRVIQPIPPDATQGKLIIGQGDELEEYTFQLGKLDPIETLTGIQARLNSLGFNCGPVNGIMSSQTEAALQSFQRKCGLPESSISDQATRDEIKRQYGR